MPDGLSGIGHEKAWKLKNKSSKFFDIRDVVAFIRLLVALKFRTFRLGMTAVVLASIEVGSLLALAAFVSSVLLGGSEQGVLGQAITMSGFHEWSFMKHSAACLVLFLTRFLLGLALANFVLLQSNDLQVKLRNILFNIGLRRGELPFGVADRGSGGSADIIVRQVNLIGKGIVEPALRVLGELFILTLIVGTILVVSPLMLVFMLVVISPLVLFYVFKFKRMTRVYGQVANSTLEGLSEYTTSFTSGWRQLGVPTLRDGAVKILDESARRFAKADRMANLISAAPRYFLEFFLALFIIVAALFTHVSPAVGVGDLVFVGGAGARLLPIVTSISNALISFQFNRAVLNNVTSRICTSDLIANISLATPATTKSNPGEACSVTKLDLDEVAYGFETGRMLFEGMSLSLAKGDFLLIKGKSGVGKTTLMDIMCGIRQPSSGEVQINGMSIRQAEWFAGRVFYSPQQPLIIPGSVLQNVTFSFSRPSQAERLCVADCIEDVGLSQEIENLADGLDSDVGPDGDMLSGGQKQRLVLARALYHSAEVFALDESISGLETDSKHSILRLVRKLSGDGRIVVLISHDVVAEEYATKVLTL